MDGDDDDDVGTSNNQQLSAMPLATTQPGNILWVLAIANLTQLVVKHPNRQRSISKWVNVLACLQPAVSLPARVDSLSAVAGLSHLLLTLPDQGSRAEQQFDAIGRTLDMLRDDALGPASPLPLLVQKRSLKVARTVKSRPINCSVRKNEQPRARFGISVECTRWTY